MGMGLVLAGFVLAPAGVIMMSIPRKHQRAEITAILGACMLVIGAFFFASATFVADFPMTVSVWANITPLAGCIGFVGFFLFRDVRRNPKLWEDDTEGIMLLSVASILIAALFFVLGAVLDPLG